MSTDAEKHDSLVRREPTIGGFPLSFVLIMTIMAVGILIVVGRLAGLF